MIPPIEAKAIREWVGENTYGPSLRAKDGDFSVLDAFLYWLHNYKYQDSSMYEFQFQRVQHAKDAELELMYAKFLMTNRKEE